MPYYEITVTVSKPICVKADCESEARDLAMEEMISDWNRIDAEVEGEFDPSDPTDARFIEEYKQQGEYFEAEEDGE